MGTKKRKAMELAKGSSSKKVGCTTRATAATSTPSDEPVEIDQNILTALLEHLSLPLIYMNETVTPLSWSQNCERTGLEEMSSAFSANILVNTSNFPLLLFALLASFDY